MGGKIVEYSLAKTQLTRFFPDQREPLEWIATVDASLRPVNVDSHDGYELMEDPRVSELFQNYFFEETARVSRKIWVKLCLFEANKQTVGLEGCPPLAALAQVFGRGNFTLTIAFGCGRLVAYEYRSGERELAMTLDDEYTSHGSLGIPRGLVRDWVTRPDPSLVTRVTIKLQVKLEAIAKLALEENLGQRRLGDRLLRAGNMDFILKVDEGEVPCHRFVLAAFSPVFKAMLASNLIETKTGSMRLFGMTKTGAEALVSFMYKEDIIQAVKDCEVAEELLKAGHLYDMGDLVAAMSKIIRIQPFSWLSVDVANNLLELTEHAEELGEVHRKALDRIQWRPRVDEAA